MREGRYGEGWEASAQCNPSSLPRHQQWGIANAWARWVSPGPPSRFLTACRQQCPLGSQPSHPLPAPTQHGVPVPTPHTLSPTQVHPSTSPFFQGTVKIRGWWGPLEPPQLVNARGRSVHIWGKWPVRSTEAASSPSADLGDPGGWQMALPEVSQGLEGGFRPGPSSLGSQEDPSSEIAPLYPRPTEKEP